MLLLLAVMLFILAVAVVVLLGPSGSEGTTGVARSLELINYRPTAREVARSELSARDRLLSPLLENTKALGRRLSPTGSSDRLARSLDRAGNPPAWPVERVFGAKGALLIVGFLLGLFLGGLTFRGLLFAAIGGAAFFWLPDLLVYNAALRRKEELQLGLANALDMLTVCVEAGQGFDSAILHVARNVDGPIAGEFARVLSEIQIGRTRAEAFSSLGDRTQAPEVKNFVSALVQADRLGLPIGAVLREQSVQMRLIRRQNAEEKAQKVTVKILFPLLLCIFPALFIVIIGPGAIRLAEAFSRL